ncbi:MAG: PD-(D/E)XK nuclease family protein, partial [Bacteroidota bacterium]
MQEPLFAMALHTTFLEDLAADLYAKHSAQLHELTIVLPNPRAGSVFKRYLATHLSQPVWAPQVLSLKRFLQEHSPLHPARPLVLTHALYQTFQALQPQEEPLERFYAWSYRLLQDFDVIDTYLINATHLFANLREQKALSLALDYLTEAQRAAIQSFWKNFEQRLSTHQQRFLRLWKQLPQVYEAFRKRLQAQGIGYPGLCQRMAYEALLQGTAPAPYQRLVFAGFNALTPVEEQVLAWYQAHRPTAFYWDVDACYLEDERQEAGTYLRAHQRKPYFQQSFVKPFPRRLEQVNEKIKVIAVAAEVGQAQIIGEQLQALMERQGPDFVPHKTAIVVADEGLLLPVLHALPLDMTQVSTTLRYPLNATATYRLLVHLIALQIAATQDNFPQDHLVISQVLTVLKHPHVLSWNPPTVQATLYSLQKTSSSQVSRATLTQENALYATLFQTLGPQDSLITYLKEVLQTLQSLLQDARVSLIPLEKKALAELLCHLDLLQEVVDPTLRQGADFAQLLQQLVQPTKIALGYNNVDGVQVVDIFSTQNLDFEQVFIVGMNEGNFPANPSTDSLLPYNLRKGYGLPLMDQHQAALYAYHFYRL